MLSIRTFEPKDHDKVIEIFRDGLYEYALEGSEVKYFHESVFETSIKSGDMKDIKTYYIDNPERTFFVAELNGEVIGIVAGLLNEDKSVEL